MTIYYAHFKGIYNTLQEEKDMKLISEIFPNAIIVNPNSKRHQKGYQTLGMKYFTDIVQKCDCLVFRSCLNGKITAGVCKEIKTAKDNHIPVIELPNLSNRKMSIKKTRKYYNTIRT